MAMTPPREGGGSIEFVSGVSAFTGEGFVQVFVNGKTLGQLSPDEVRQHGQAAFEAAEAAESDALIWAQLKEAGLDDTACGAFLVAMRERRKGGD